MDKDKNCFRGILSLNAPTELGYRPCVINTFYTSEYVDRRRVLRGEIIARAIVYPSLATLKDQHTLFSPIEISSNEISSSFGEYSSSLPACYGRSLSTPSTTTAAVDYHWQDSDSSSPSGLESHSHCCQIFSFT